MKLAFKLTILITTLITFCVFNNVHAESFQSSQSVSFTFNPTVSITVSGDLVIESLTPGDYKDSNIITVTASSNAIAGYSLTSTVGTSTNTSNELRKGGTDTTNKFTNLTANQSTLSNFSDNTWGYSYSLDSGSTWISGSTGDTATGYNGYTYDTTTSTSETITHLNSTTFGSSTVQYKIGAKASTTQIAGEYTNVINFIGIANPNPSYITLDEAIYMQDDFSCIATPVGTVKKLIDSRDGQEYLVARAMDGNCWMIENLKLGKALDSTTTTSITLTPTDSNVTDSFTMNYTDIPTDGKFHAYTIDDVPYQNNSNEWICRGGEDDWDSCYYNWFTATAGSGTSYVTTGNVETSICPAGWTLPTGDSSGQFQGLYDQYNSVTSMLVDDPRTTKNNSVGKIPGFLLSGNYSTSGAVYFGYRSIYHSRTTLNAQLVHELVIYPNLIEPAGNGSKYAGFAVRCLKSS